MAESVNPSLHDAVVSQFAFDFVRGRLEAVIWRKEEDNSIVWWQLMISGVSNKNDVQLAYITINNILAKEKRAELGFRINEFSCKKQPDSGRQSVYLVELFIDYLEPMRIECAKCTLRTLESKLFAANP
ncbi:hypothetical protein DNI29_21310 [Hymenobacter sediminis]|uniref:hypothetical protein n=1 Tax=Hymenobacter sediminis TaxID=2218621 RepID=UPI000DA6AE2C|nr:hypothetical protein [Hymenobacter sediminis]RPD44670.1 hypothetical protein DNI29_21310 [Hymenobacter sediminis]